MTGRGLAVQGGLALVGLVTVYATWQREPERAPGAVTVIDASKSDVTLVHYEDDTTAVDLTRGKTGDDDGVWLHLVTKPKTEAKPDPKADPKAAKPATPPAPPPPRDLPGADNAKKLFEQFAPLVSMRAFGVLDAAKLKELGLDNPKRKVAVTVKGAVRDYEIGQPTTTSSGESFLRDIRDGRVYLMPRNLLTELQNASHLVDRRLHTLEITEFDRFKLSSGGKQKEFVSVGRESPKTIGFAPAKTPDKKDQMVKNWHDALWRIFPTELLGKGEEPPGGKLSIILRVDYTEKGKNVGWIEIGRVETASGVTEDAAPTGDLYARTEHTAGWAKIPSGGTVIPDAQKLIAAP
ncbi:MAG TPA: DUF4340 domain-containing protein [Polyangia bacterium]|nr:DUF4340 domain-containing protein [Polyangia bacterium]